MVDPSVEKKRIGVCVIEEWIDRGSFQVNVGNDKENGSTTSRRSPTVIQTMARMFTHEQLAKKQS